MRSSMQTAIEVTLRLQAGPGTVPEIADELQIGEKSVRTAVYRLRRMQRVQADGYRAVGRNGGIKAVLWKWAGNEPDKRPACRSA